MDGETSARDDFARKKVMGTQEESQKIFFSS